MEQTIKDVLSVFLAVVAVLMVLIMLFYSYKISVEQELFKVRILNAWHFKRIAMKYYYLEKEINSVNKEKEKHKNSIEGYIESARENRKRINKTSLLIDYKDALKQFARKYGFESKYVPISDKLFIRVSESVFFKEIESEFE